LKHEDKRPERKLPTCAPSLVASPWNRRPFVRQAVASRAYNGNPRQTHHVVTLEPSRSGIVSITQIDRPLCRRGDGPQPTMRGHPRVQSLRRSHPRHTRSPTPERLEGILQIVTLACCPYREVFFRFGSIVNVPTSGECVVVPLVREVSSGTSVIHRHMHTLTLQTHV
jgi:hypothetical protein